MAKFLRRINYNGTNYEIADLAYAVCSTPSDTLSKVVDSGNSLDFELLDGIKVVVKFENAVTVQNSTLKVGNTAAKLMKYNGAVLGSDVIKANQVCQFVYSSTEDAWIMVGGTGSGEVDFSDVMIIKGSVSPTSGLPAVYEKGATYIVDTAGDITIGSGAEAPTISSCEVGDIIICIDSNDAAANASASDWTVIQANVASHDIYMVKGVDYVTAGKDSSITMGARATAEGSGTKPTGDYSHAEGSGTTASGVTAHAEGGSTIASGGLSHAQGAGTTASGTYAHAEGAGTVSSGVASHSEGINTVASGDHSHAEGQKQNATITLRNVDYTTGALGKASHVEGVNTVAGISNNSLGGHAEGYATVATGNYSHAEGYQTLASGTQAHAEGNYTQAAGNYSHAEGYGSEASGPYSHAEGGYTKASNDYAHAEGNSTTASGDYSHAEGRYTKATGDFSHAEGNSSEATGSYSHAEGNSTEATESSSHAEGNYTKATESYSHAEGYYTTSSGYGSHAEGNYTTASGDYSHAEGYHTSASGDYSHAEGNYTEANHKSQHVFGEFNILDSSTAYSFYRGNYVEIVGNGLADSSRSNARTLDWYGNEILAGKLTIGADPSANMDVATKQYVDNSFAANDAMVYKGVIAGTATSPGTYTPAADCGHAYKVSAEGYINGQKVEAGDLLICTADSTVAATSSNYATVQSTWTIVQANLDGAVIGPVNSLDGNIAIFSGTTGKLIADGGITVGGLATAGHVHGNISNTGTMSSTGVALANGDSLVFSDSSNSGKIEKTYITFDGSTDVDALTAAGTWREFVPALIMNGSVTTSLEHINDGTGDNNGFFFDVTAPDQPEGTRRSQFGVGLTDNTGIGLVSTEGIYIGGITQLNGTLIPAAQSSSIGTVSNPWSSIYGDLYGNAATASAAQLNTTQYGVAYYNDAAGAFAGTAAGSANQVLVSGGGTTPPSWKTLNTTTVNSTAVSYSNGILTLSSTTPTVVSSFTNEASM